MPIGINAEIGMIPSSDAFQSIATRKLLDSLLQCHAPSSNATEELNVLESDSSFGHHHRLERRKKQEAKNEIQKLELGLRFCGENIGTMTMTKILRALTIEMDFSSEGCDSVSRLVCAIDRRMNQSLSPSSRGAVVSVVRHVDGSFCRAAATSGLPSDVLPRRVKDTSAHFAALGHDEDRRSELLFATRCRHHEDYWMYVVASRS